MGQKLKGIKGKLSYLFFSRRLGAAFFFSITLLFISFDIIFPILQNKEELFEQLMSAEENKQQVTFLVLCEGDNVNFFRVSERTDGEVTPSFNPTIYLLNSLCKVLFSIRNLELGLALQLRIKSSFRVF